MDTNQPIIIKRVKKIAAGHHGGAWKIAFADFAVAMMAFLLVMWLMSSATPEQKKAIDLQGGVVIQEVQDGPAAMIGLRAGDVITHLNNQAVLSAQAFTQIAKDLPSNRSVSMRVLRQGRASFITFKLAN